MGKKKSKRENTNVWQKKEYFVHSDADEQSEHVSDNNTESDLDENVIFREKNPQHAEESKEIFAFDSASDESDDEKMLEERLRQFEMTNLKAGSEDSDEDDGNLDEMDDEFIDSSYRPLKNKYGGIDEQHIEVDEDDDDDEPSAAILEEREAKIIQKRLVSMVSESDVNLELLGVAVDEDVDGKELKVAEYDISSKGGSAKQLKQLTDKRFPEIELLITKIKEELEWLNSTYLPLVRLIERKNDLREKIGRSALSFVRAKHMLGFTYCVNAIFYLRLRARHEAVEGHPVTSRLLSCQKLLKQLDSAEKFFMKPGKRLQALLAALRLGASSDELVRIAEQQFASTPTSLPKGLLFVDNQRSDFQTVDNETEQPAEKMETDIEKRKLSGKMEKTGGAPRPKTKRNPRVANRSRFAKALKRRKAAGFKEYQPPINPYGGEVTGIRAGLRRSTKLKM